MIADALRLSWLGAPGAVAREWGSTPAERARVYPCDAYLPPPAEPLWRAIDVDAPPSRLFRWLCQLRVAPYSYDWIDNLGRRSPGSLTPGLEHLARGQRVMTMFELVAFEPHRHLTATTGPTPFGTIAASYVVEPRQAGSRLIVKILVRPPSGPLGFLVRWLLPWGDLIMMRKQLLNLKHLAESRNDSSSG
jgi:hypothetical protein